MPDLVCYCVCAVDLVRCHGCMPAGVNYFSLSATEEKPRPGWRRGSQLARTGSSIRSGYRNGANPVLRGVRIIVFYSWTIENTTACDTQVRCLAD